jgi:hypothetical protein
MPLPIQKISDLSVSLWARNTVHNENRVFVALPNIFSLGILPSSPATTLQADLTIRQLFNVVDSTRNTLTKVTNKEWYKMGITASYNNGRYSMFKNELIAYS